MRSDKTMTEFENDIITKTMESNEISQYKLLYMHHFDLFMKHERTLKSVFDDSEFDLYEYVKMKNAWYAAKQYLGSLSPVFSVSGVPGKYTSMDIQQMSPKAEKPKYSFMSGKHPENSIFSQISPKTFAEKCHRLFVAGYFVHPTRTIQYRLVYKKSVSCMPSWEGCSDDFKMFYWFPQNFASRLKSEIDIYCEHDKIKLIVDAMIVMIKTFLDLGNMSLASNTWRTLRVLKNCKSVAVLFDKFGDGFYIEDSAKHKKFSYFVDATDIAKHVVHINEMKKTAGVGDYSKIYNAVYTTKQQLLPIISSLKADKYDNLVFNFINPLVLIEGDLHEGDLLRACISRACPLKVQIEDSDSSSLADTDSDVSTNVSDTLTDVSINASDTLSDVSITEGSADEMLSQRGKGLVKSGPSKYVFRYFMFEINLYDIMRRAKRMNVPFINSEVKMVEMWWEDAKAEMSAYTSYDNEVIYQKESIIFQEYQYLKEHLENLISENEMYASTASTVDTDVEDELYASTDVEDVLTVDTDVEWVENGIYAGTSVGSPKYKDVIEDGIYKMDPRREHHPIRPNLSKKLMEIYQPATVTEGTVTLVNEETKKSET